ncbi:Transmembrane protein 14A [Vanrija pseudolonga]|uniref:Transmembrane protein 14A n=1 Tax=Vanrija pseudolonga TaxID=143232 RepID=A0AAF0YA08_9TREE|nr:Transmembrane protein 14A [Vanrija pseudolonga]
MAASNDIIGYVYAALVITGGLIGFIKRGSTMSLVAGGSTGLLAGYGALRASRNPKDVYVALSVAVLLTVLMGSRFARSGKFMPAGLVAALSLAQTLRYGARLRA